MSNYSDIDFIMNLEVGDFIEMVEKSFERENEAAKLKRDELLLHRWGYELPFMEEVLTFNEYRDLAINNTGKREDTKSISKYTNDELIEKIERIREKDQARATGGED